jgi:small-conductance mechanosensitive channel
MPPSPIPPTSDEASSPRLFNKTRTVLWGTLLVLLIVCVVFTWMTRGALTYLHGRSGARGGGQSLVNLQPWQTAQALAALAVTAEENEYAHDAERLADHEVDQAFAAALRQARLDAEHDNLTGEAQALAQKVAQLQQLKQQDQALFDSLTSGAGPAAGAAKNGAQNAPPSDDAEVAKAQLGLDTDELADAQRDLERASGDHSAEIQDELTAHEASMRKYDSEAKNGGQIAIVSAKQDHTLATRLGAWFRQREREGLIAQALEEAQNDVRNLTAEHTALEAKANAAPPASAAPNQATHLANLTDLSVERQILSIDDDRIETEQQLAAVYAKWQAQVKLQHQIVVHMILQSFTLILIILAFMLVSDAIIRRVMDRPAKDRRRMRTLRSILELSVQVLGAGIILVVIFGSPKETPTILGLVTAALTIALQDYILAFLGWFILMGKNGIHVGDWVEIYGVGSVNGVAGTVTEIGLMSTTLLETGGLADQGYPTGRRISFMNGFAIRGQYFNFSTAGQWMWDEIAVSVPAATDVHALMEEVQKVVAEETVENSRRAEKEWKHGKHGEELGRFSARPVVNLRPSGSGIDLQIRYVTSASRRIDLRNRLYQRVVDLLHAQSEPVR